MVAAAPCNWHKERRRIDCNCSKALADDVEPDN